MRASVVELELDLLFGGGARKNVETTRTFFIY